MIRMKYHVLICCLFLSLTGSLLAQEVGISDLARRPDTLSNLKTIYAVLPPSGNGGLHLTDRKILGVISTLACRARVKVNVRFNTVEYDKNKSTTIMVDDMNIIISEFHNPLIQNITVLPSEDRLFQLRIDSTMMKRLQIPYILNIYSIEKSSFINEELTIDSYIWRMEDTNGLIMDYSLSDDKIYLSDPWQEAASNSIFLGNLNPNRDHPATEPAKAYGYHAFTMGGQLSENLQNPSAGFLWLQNYFAGVSALSQYLNSDVQSVQQQIREDEEGNELNEKTTQMSADNMLVDTQPLIFRIGLFGGRPASQMVINSDMESGMTLVEWNKIHPVEADIFEQLQKSRAFQRIQNIGPNEGNRSN